MRHAAATFIHNFVTLPNHIFIIVNKPLSKLATLLILKLSPSSSGFDEFSNLNWSISKVNKTAVNVYWLPWSMLKIFRWICLSFFFARHFINPKVHYDNIKWMKNETAKRRRKLESDSRPCLKTKTCTRQKVQDSERRKETQKRNFETGYKRCEIAIKKLRWYRRSNPSKIDSKTSSFVENFCHVTCLQQLLVDQQRCLCGPLRKQLLVIRPEAEREQRKAF